MARAVSAKRPKNMAYTVKRLLSYMGRHKFSLLLVAFLVSLSVICNLLGTYMIRPVINGIASGGGMESLVRGVMITALIYIVGVLAAVGYTQIMARLTSFGQKKSALPIGGRRFKFVVHGVVYCCMRSKSSDGFTAMTLLCKKSLILRVTI